MFVGCIEFGKDIVVLYNACFINYKLTDIDVVLRMKYIKINILYIQNNLYEDTLNDKKQALNFKKTPAISTIDW